MSHKSGPARDVRTHRILTEVAWHRSCTGHLREQELVRDSDGKYIDALPSKFVAQVRCLVSFSVERRETWSRTASL